MATDNAFAQRARYAKAERLARAAAALGVSADLAGMMDDSAWESLARIAQVNPPSGTTRQLMIDLLRRAGYDSDQRGAGRQGEKSHPEPVDSYSRGRVGACAGPRATRRAVVGVGPDA